jgi:hypothetical protein
MTAKAAQTAAAMQKSTSSIGPAEPNPGHRHASSSADPHRDPIGSEKRR